MLHLLARLNSARLWRFEISAAGNRFRPPTLDRLIALFLFRLGMMGREEFHLFRSLLRPGMTVADVGANQGVFTLFFADRVGPTGAVLAFEPDSEMFSCLNANARANAKSWVELHNLALGAEEGQLTFNVSRLNRGDNRLVPANQPPAASPSNVRVVTLDQILNGRTVDLIKMDVQGWEGAALRGMKRLLASPNPPWIHLEVCPHILHMAGSSFGEIRDLLQHYGYTLFQADTRQLPLDFQKVAKLKGALGYTNVLAVPPQRLRQLPRALS